MLDAVTWWDIFGGLRAVVTFSAVLLAPGYCIGSITDLSGFRQRPMAERFAWAVALSFAVIPIVDVEAAKHLTLAFDCALAVICFCLFLWYFVRDSRGSGVQVSPRRRWRSIAAGVAWTLFVFAVLIDAGIGRRLYFSVTVYDHALRTTFVDAVLRTGVPPANPLYWPGHAAPMRYYYFWYVVTAVATKLAGATARQGMIASVVWAGFGLAAVVTLYCKHFLPAEDRSRNSAIATNTRFFGSRSALAIGLLWVAGMDVVAEVIKLMFGGRADGDLEWWSPDLVTSWIDSVLWVPHHIAGLICCLVGFLLVWLSRGLRARDRLLYTILAGTSFASAFGLSIWVAVAFAMVSAVWCLWVLVAEKRLRSCVPILVGAGLIGCVLILPFVAELHAEAAVSATHTAGRSSFLRLGIRRMIEPQLLLVVPFLKAFSARHPRLEIGFARLVLLIPGYFLELGFWFLVLVHAFRSRAVASLGEAGRSLRVLVCISLLVATFIRSTVIANNDFGYRSILLTQFFLLLFAVAWLEGIPPRTTARWHSDLKRAMIWLGLVGMAYQVICLRVYLPVEESLHRPEEAGLAEYSMALRRVFDAADRRLPRDARLQYFPRTPGVYFGFAGAMQANRQLVNAFTECESAFGGEQSACAGIQDGVNRLFDGGTNAPGAAEAEFLCAKLGIDDLVVTRWDGIWPDRESWVWHLPLVTDVGDARIVHCRAVSRDGLHGE